MQLACCVVFPSCCVPCVTVRSEIQNLLLPQCSISLLLSHTSSTNKVVLTAADYSNKDSIRICTFSLYVELNHSNEGEWGGVSAQNPPPPRLFALRQLVSNAETELLKTGMHSKLWFIAHYEIK